MEQDTARFGLRVSPVLTIPGHELETRATRASGPGGQHVNKSSTRVELLWRLADSRAVDEVQRERLRHKLAPRLTAGGELRVVVSDTRSQKQNRAIAERRLALLVARALSVPKARKKTAPTKSSIERRLSSKHLRSQKKRDRRAMDAE
jgi:ribosome-associated protein